MLRFIAYLHLQDVPYSSIMPILSALSYKHKMEGLPDPCKAFKINQLLNSIKKNLHKVDKRLPISIDLLNKIIESLYLLGLSNYETTLFKAMFSAHFFFALRIGEITDSKHNILINQITISADNIMLNFKSYKHSSSNSNADSPHVVNQSASPACPVVNINNYLQLRGNKFGPLFKLRDKAVSSTVYSNTLKSILKVLGKDISKFSSHSFRIGAATYWSNIGFSELQIKRMGRWKSNAIFKYLRGPINHTKLE